MICQDNYLKIIDLGTCKKFAENSHHKTYTIIGTPQYMAP
jgi:serine/threonine protein kinase